MRVVDELREQGRGMAGALLVLGISFSYTIETWWLAMGVPPEHLVVLFVAGVGLVIPITRSVGFRKENTDEMSRAGGSPVWVELAELVFQSFFIAYALLFLLGIINLDTPLSVLIRTGMVLVIPLAFGAALANELLSGEQDEMPEVGFPRSLGVFALGAVFLAAPIAPTEEVTIVAEQAEWTRLAALVVASLVVTYLVLYELEFRGQSMRLKQRSRLWHSAQTCVVYTTALVVALGLLIALGSLGAEPLSTWVRRTVALSLPATIGAGAARVVLS